MKTHIEPTPCPVCGKPVDVEIDNATHAVMGSPDYDIIGGLAFHAKCWVDKIEAGMADRRKRPAKTEAEDEQDRNDAVLSLSRVFDGMTHEAMISCLASYVTTQAHDGVELAQMIGMFGLGIGALMQTISPDAFEIKHFDGSKL